MVSKTEQSSQNWYAIEHLGSKVKLKLLKFIFDALPLNISLSGAAEALATSKSSISRSLERLQRMELARAIKNGGQATYRVDISSH
jgi:DNA-binding IclR family transcriptional regulator